MTWPVALGWNIWNGWGVTEVTVEGQDDDANKRINYRTKSVE